MSTTSTANQQSKVPAAGRYHLDPVHSSVSFRTRHLLGLGRVSGTMRVTGGQITVDPAASRATVTATINAASFDTGSRRRDRDVHSAKYLHAGKYPDITFRAGTLSRDGAHWTLAGELIVRGVSSPVTLAIESVEPADPGFRARATARIDRYAFGLTAAKGLAARHLDITLTARAKPW
jgi:polyisoprenoid-binding protein YceI